VLRNDHLLRKLLATAVWLAAALTAADNPEKGAPPAKDSWLTLPFLEVFFNRPTTPKLEAASVLINQGAAQVHGYLVRPLSDKPLPAVLILAGENGLGAPVLQAARELADIGFVALAIDYDPEHTAEASALVQTVTAGQLGDRVDAAIAWVRGQPFVDGQRIGGVGWAGGAAWALRLAHEGKLQAAVLSGGLICSQPDELLQVSATPLLVIGGRRSGCTPSIVSALQQRVVAAGLPHTVDFYSGASGAFPETPSGGTEDDQAWVNIYEFLGKHVEDVLGGKTEASGQAENQFVRIVDIMRVINSDNGVRGRLSSSLAYPPSGDEQWDQMRSEAAVLAEAGNLLLALRPPKGTVVGWRERAIEFRGAAQTLLRAIERRDFLAAQEALRVLPKSCASCHADYR
jgi:dienelactone hydrolase